MERIHSLVEVVEVVVEEEVVEGHIRSWEVVEGHIHSLVVEGEVHIHKMVEGD